ncbi:MAG: SIS domain-containing protein, partial [Chloroflexota bacterium]
MSARKDEGRRQLLAEIGEQPQVVARVLQEQRQAVHRVADAVRQRASQAFVLVARGSSDNAAVYGRYLFEICNRVLTSLAAPSTVTLYGRGPDLAKTTVIAISQSGQGEDVVTYLQEARKQGATTVAVVNEAASPLAAAAEWVLECFVGRERSVPATKTVTAQMTLLAMLSAALAGDGDGRALAGLPAALARGLDRREDAVTLAQRLAEATAMAVIGRGFAYAVALETALKLKETSYTRAEPFSAADFRHGPVALVRPGYAALLIDVGGQSTAPALAMGTLVSSRGGRPLLLRAGELAPAPAEMAG